MKTNRMVPGGNLRAERDRLVKELNAIGRGASWQFTDEQRAEFDEKIRRLEELNAQLGLAPSTPPHGRNGGTSYSVGGAPIGDDEAADPGAVDEPPPAQRREAPMEQLSAATPETTLRYALKEGWIELGKPAIPVRGGCITEGWIARAMRRELEEALAEIDTRTDKAAARAACERDAQDREAQSNRPMTEDELAEFDEILQESERAAEYRRSTEGRLERLETVLTEIRDQLSKK